MLSRGVGDQPEIDSTSPAPRDDLHTGLSKALGKDVERKCETSSWHSLARVACRKVADAVRIAQLARYFCSISQKLAFDHNCEKCSSFRYCSVYRER